MLVDKCEGNGVLVEDGGCLETRGMKVTEPMEKKKEETKARGWPWNLGKKGRSECWEWPEMGFL